MMAHLGLQGGQEVAVGLPHGVEVLLALNGLHKLRKLDLDHIRLYTVIMATHGCECTKNMMEITAHE